jgi:hypothetical protein
MSVEGALAAVRREGTAQDALTMDIKKLDKEKYFEEKDEKEKDERAIRKSKRVPRVIAENPWKSRMRIYLAVMAALLVASAVNLYLNRSMFSFSYQDTELVGAELETAFYRLCFDIEFIKHETGEYPASIDGYKFSSRLAYSREKDGSFLLIFDGKKTELSYNSAEDSEKIK